MHIIDMDIHRIFAEAVVLERARSADLAASG